MSAVARLGIAAFSLVLSAVLIVRFLFPYLAPFLIAVLLAAIIDPVVDWLEQKAGFRRGFAVLLVLFVVLVILIILITLLVTNVTSELNSLIQNASDLGTEMNRIVADLVASMQNLYAGLSGLPAPLSNLVQASAARLSQTIESLARSFLGFLGGLPGLFFNLVIASLATFFISRDKNVFFNYLLGLTPKSWRRDMLRLKSEVATGILGFLRSQLILISITGVLSVIGLTVLRVRYAWILGILAGLLDLIPMIGPSGVFIPMIVYNAVTGSFVHAILLAAVLGFILLVRQISEPRILGSGLGIHPLTSLVSMYLGAKILGVNGFLLGPIVMIFLKAIMVVVILPMIPDE